MKKIVLYLLFFCIGFTAVGQGLKTSGKKIVDQNGSDVLLRGMGLGGWMLMEGYMMHTADYERDGELIKVAGTQHRFRARLIELMGEQKTDEFFDAWLANHVTKADIDSLASWGFNSVRLPMHYNLFTLPIEEEPVQGQQTWLTKGFEMVDDLLDWCEVNNMYVILDLHAAPGAQGYNADISDYDDTKPSLWESQENKNKTIALWRKLAERYKDEPWIGGYDLLNEVNWNLPGNSALTTLYKDITTSIREVDTKHIIFIEGNGFANDFSGSLTPPWDDNMVYSFHKYWSFNEQENIQWMLDIRNTHNIPLWMGEAGENSNTWFTEAISLFEENNIGWSWWPMKRIETIVSPFSIFYSEGYKKVRAYWRDEGPKPTSAETYSAMMELANNSNSENCTYNKSVPDAMIRQVATEETIPYKDHYIPGLVYASDYDLGRLGIAYNDVDYANYQLSTGSFSAWNSGWWYRNDGVDIEPNNEVTKSNGYHVGYIREGEWINYTVNINETALYTVSTSVAAPSGGGTFHFAVDGEDNTKAHEVGSTGGWTSFQKLDVADVLLEAGKHVFTVHFDGGSEFNLGSLDFVKSGDVADLAFEALNGETQSDAYAVEVDLSLKVDQASLINTEDKFTLKVNEEIVPITSLEVVGDKERTVVLHTDKILVYTDNIKLSYSGTEVLSTTGKTLESFSDLPIRNTLKALFILPGKIEAEDYIYMEGLGIEDTSDTGGGKNIGYTDANDFADYAIYSAKDQNFRMYLRIAAAWDEGNITFYLVDDNDNETALVTVTTPVTDGWQTWETISADLSIPAGKHTLRMRINTGGFNMNWMEFESIDIELDNDNDGVGDNSDLCPNTPEGDAVDTNGCFTLPVDNFDIQVNSESCPDRENGKISITATKTYNYVVTFKGVNRNFTGAIAFSGLEPGSYDLCISVTGKDFEQCYSVEVASGTTVAGKSSTKNYKTSVEILTGTAPFQVLRNGKTIMETMSNHFDVDVEHGDLVEVKTSVDCEGVFAKVIELYETVVAYPNPSSDYFEIALPVQEKDILIEVYNYAYQRIKSGMYKVKYGKVNLDMKDNPTGSYIVKIHLEKPVSIKILKQ